MRRVQIKDDHGRRLKRYREQLRRENTHTLVVEECLERDMGELYGICSTGAKQEADTQHQ